MSTNALLSLAELQNELTRWRSHRQPRHIPQRIREQAVRLLAQHKPCEIKSALNINHRTLKRWKEECSPLLACPSTEKPPMFISLPAEAPLSAASIGVSVLELKVTRHACDGSSISVEGHLSLEHWRSALSLLTTQEVVA